MENKIKVFRVVKATAGRFHSWCNSNVGLIRKPNIFLREEIETKWDRVEPVLIPIISFIQKVINWIKKLFRIK